jgi:hypothetical protein
LAECVAEKLPHKKGALRAPFSTPDAQNPIPNHHEELHTQTTQNPIPTSQQKSWPVKNEKRPALNWPYPDYSYVKEHHSPPERRAEAHRSGKSTIFTDESQQARHRPQLPLRDAGQWYAPAVTLSGEDDTVLTGKP